MLEQLGATTVVADVLDASAIEQVVRETSPTHMVHLLHAFPKNGPLRASDLATTNKLRTVGTANLLQAAIAAGVRRMVGESFISVYGYGNHAGGMRTEADAFPAQESDSGLQEVVDALRSLEHQLLAANQQGLIEAIPWRLWSTAIPEKSITLWMTSRLV